MTMIHKVEKDKAIKMPKKVSKKFILSLYHGKEFIRDGHIIINPIGEALYVDVWRLTPEEIDEIKKMKLQKIL